MPFQYGEGQREGPGHQLWLRSPPARGNHHRRSGDQCIWGLTVWGGIDFARAHTSPLHLESKASVSVCASRTSPPAGHAAHRCQCTHPPRDSLGKGAGGWLPVTPSSHGCWNQSPAGRQQQPRVREEMLPTPQPHPWTLRPRPRPSQAVMCSVAHSVATLSKGWVSDGFVKADLVHMAPERAPAEKRRGEERRGAFPRPGFPCIRLAGLPLNEGAPFLTFFPSDFI